MNEQKIIDELSRFVGQTRLSSKTALVRSAREVYEAIRPYIGIPFPSVEEFEENIRLYMSSLDHPGANLFSTESLAKCLRYNLMQGCAGIVPKDDLAEIKSALDLPDDTPEPLVGVIWGSWQRIEDLEEEIKRLGQSTFEVCGETLGDFICDDIKRHKGHHAGTRKTGDGISWPNDA